MKDKWLLRGWTPSLTFGALIHSVRAGTVPDALLSIEYTLGLVWAGPVRAPFGEIFVPHY